MADTHETKQHQAPAQEDKKSGGLSVEQKIEHLQEQVSLLLRLHLQGGSHTDEVARLHELEDKVRGR